MHILSNPKGHQHIESQVKKADLAIKQVHLLLYTPCLDLSYSNENRFFEDTFSVEFYSLHRFPHRRSKLSMKLDVICFVIRIGKLEIAARF